MGNNSNDNKKLEVKGSSPAQKAMREKFARDHSLADVLPETNTAFLGHIMEVMKISEGADRKDVESLKERFVRYITLCHKTGFKIGNMTAYMAMGIDENTASSWFYGRSGTPEHTKLIREVKKFCAAYREQLLMESNSGMNPIVGIFWQKNFDGLRDNFDGYEVIAEEETKKTAAEIADEYGASMVDEKP